MAYKPQYYTSNTSVGKNRSKHMSCSLEKLRDLSLIHLRRSRLRLKWRYMWSP